MRGSRRRQHGHARRIAACSCAAWLAAAVAAQEPKPTPQPTPQPSEPQAPTAPQQGPTPQAQPETPTPQPTTPNPQAAPQQSDADRAAEALRKALGLKKGPTQGDPHAPKATPDAAAQTGSQDPKPQQATQPDTDRPTVEPSDRAADSLRDLMPKAVSPLDPSQPSAAPDRASRDEHVARAAGEDAYPVHGSVSTRYRSRHSGSETDQDLGVSTSIDAGDRERHAVTAHFAGRGFLDLDGIQQDSSLNGLDETFDESLGGYVYAAHADLHRVPGLDLARVGRQSIVDAPQWIDVDGAAAETKRHGSMRVFGSAFVGAPVRYWDGTTHGDRAYGTAVGLQPWQGGRIRLDWMHVDDDLYAVDGSDDLVSMQAWHSVSDSANVYAKHTWLDGDPRDFVLRGNGYFESLGLDGSLTYRELLTTQTAQTTDFDPYSPMFVTYAPYRQLEALLAKQFGERWSLTGGCDARQLRDEGDESQFNREYSRLYFGPAVEKLFDEDLTLSAQAEFWDATDGEYSTISGDLRWRASKQTTATLGTSYARFAYDAFAGEERDNARTWYLRVQHRPRPSLRVEGSLAHESNDIDSYVHFRIGTTWTF